MNIMPTQHLSRPRNNQNMTIYLPGNGLDEADFQSEPQ